MRNLHTLAKKKHVIGIENVKFLKVFKFVNNAMAYSYLRRNTSKMY